MKRDNAIKPIQDLHLQVQTKVQVMIKKRMRRISKKKRKTRKKKRKKWAILIKEVRSQIIEMMR